MERHSVVLEITTWPEMFLGAEHFYGHLYGYIDEKLQVVELEDVLTKSEAIELSRKDKFTYRKGSKTGRFTDPKRIRQLAKKVWKKHFPTAEVLLEGRFAVAEPQKYLAGDVQYREWWNRFRTAKTLKEQDEICNEFWEWVNR